MRIVSFSLKKIIKNCTVIRNTWILNFLKKSKQQTNTDKSWAHKLSLFSPMWCPFLTLWYIQGGFSNFIHVNASGKTWLHMLWRYFILRLQWKLSAKNWVLVPLPNTYWCVKMDNLTSQFSVCGYHSLTCDMDGICEKHFKETNPTNAILLPQALCSFASQFAASPSLGTKLYVLFFL